jgi:hypothetical protein
MTEAFAGSIAGSGAGVLPGTFNQSSMNCGLIVNNGRKRAERAAGQRLLDVRSRN